MAVQLGGNAMQYFKAGQEGGAASSPTGGMRSAIQGIVQQGRKLGLIQEQSTGNYNTAVGAADYKNQLATDYGNQDIQTPLYNDKGIFMRNLDHKRAIKPIVQKGLTPEQEYFQRIIDEEDAADAKDGTGLKTSPLADFDKAFKDALK